MAKRDKPLVRPMSPWTQYINRQSMHTMGLSILHRITGLALSVGSILLVYWLWSVASGREQYATAYDLFSTQWMRVLLVGWLFSFCYHFLNGIRHLVWDTGRGFGLKTSRMSGYFVLIAALVISALLSLFFMSQAGVAP